MKHNALVPCLIWCLVQVYTVRGLSIDAFTCDTNNNVVLPATDLKHFKLISDTGNLCIPSTKTFINCNVKNSSSIHVLYTDEEEGIIVGGRNTTRYELTCEDKKQVIKATYNALNVTESPPTYTTKSILNEHTVSLDILKNKVPLGSTAVHIGEQLTLEMKGPDNHKIKPENCTANDGALSYTFWKCDTYDPAITNQAWVSQQPKLTNDLFAFRFINSTTVNIECYVSVCPNGINECDVQTCSTSGKRRRRRNLQDINPEKAPSATEAVASVSFYVIGDEISNKSTGLAVNSVLAGIAAVIAFCFFK